MKKIKIILLGIFFLTIGCYFLWVKVLWKTFSCSIAGSYECAQTWDFNVKESELVKIIREIKIEHPNLEVPNYGFPVEDRHEYWYNIVFYYSDTNQNVYTWVRSHADSLNTTLALISIAHHNNENDPPDSMRFDVKEINRDFEYFDNKRQIKKFEETIVKLIENKIASKR